MSSVCRLSVTRVYCNKMIEAVFTKSSITITLTKKFKKVFYLLCLFLFLFAANYLQLFCHNKLALQMTNNRQHLTTIAELCNAIATFR